MFANSGLGRWWGVIGDRAIMVASTTYRSQDASNSPIRDQIEHLRIKLERLISADRVRVVGEGACYAYWCCDDEAEQLLRAAIQALDDEVVACRSFADIGQTEPPQGASASKTLSA